jgi:NADH-quinone oxidoreductase subunit K
MLLSININFVAFSAFLHDLVGQIFAIFVLTVAGAEAAIGLAILVIYFRTNRTIEIKDISSLRG